MNVYQLQEKRRRKKNGAIKLLILALLDFFLYAVLTEILAPIADEVEALEALITSAQLAKMLLILLLVSGIIEMVCSIVFFCQLPAMDKEILRAEQEQQRRWEHEQQLRIPKLEQAKTAAASAPAAAEKSVEGFIYCPQCRRKLPERAIYCASCGHKQK